jgi:hypothetical protein
VELLHFVIGNIYRKMIIYMGELFYLTWKTEGDILSFGVLNFGPKNETNNFKYGIKIGSSDAYAAVTCNCHSYLQSGLNDIKPWNCVILHLFQIQEHIGELGELSCEIEMGKWKLDGFISSFCVICVHCRGHGGSTVGGVVATRRAAMARRAGALTKPASAGF